MNEMLENGQKPVKEEQLDAKNDAPISESKKDEATVEASVERSETVNSEQEVVSGKTESITSPEENGEDKIEEISVPDLDTTDSDAVNKINYDLGIDETEEDHDDDDADVGEGAVEDDKSDSSQALTIEEIVSKLQILLDSEVPERKGIDEAKNQFYRAARYETEQQKVKFAAAGGDEIDFVLKEPALFTQGKELLQKLKEKRLEIASKEEELKQKNLARKLAIIERVKELTESQDDFNKIYQEFKALQQEWNEIRLVPQAKINELWKSYQHYVEIFYDLVRINNEFREYDFKKNLELKTELCESAEKLLEEPDTISAFHQLQRFHQQWRDIGPVARKDREPTWLRFKEASTEINKRYQAHFEELRADENENLEKKQALCKVLESIDYETIESFRDWDNKMREVLDIQTQWKEIGYVPRKWNSKIYQRYRAACDMFFRNKNEFYKSMREEMEKNLQKKTALCERAEAMKDSDDWKNTTQDMIAIQKEWKTIGHVPRKHSDAVWKRFIAACDYFFEQKKMNTSSRYAEEQKNLDAKKEVLEKIHALDVALGPEESLTALKGLMAEFNAIGFVPYKQKDKIYKEFHDAVDVQFERLNIDKSQRKLESFKTNLSEISKSDKAKGQFLHEREKLMRQYDRMKNELQTYENNIGFLSISSKKGNSLVDDMNKKVKKLKEEMELIIKKIEAIDGNLS